MDAAEPSGSRRKADQRSLRDARRERLRAAYRELVAVGMAFPHQAAGLGVAAAYGQQKGTLKPFVDKMGEETRDITEARASLLLEEDRERAVLDKLQELSNAHLGFLASMIAYVEKDQTMPHEEFEPRVMRMQAKTEELAALARERLADLDKPI